MIDAVRRTSRSATSVAGSARRAPRALDGAVCRGSRTPGRPSRSCRPSRSSGSSRRPIALLEEAGLEIRSPKRARPIAQGGRARRRRSPDAFGSGATSSRRSFGSRRNASCCMPAIRRADLHVGGNVVNFGPVNGAPNVRDLEGGRRYGDIAAFRDILKDRQRPRRAALAGRRGGRAGRRARAGPPSRDVPRTYRMLRHRLGGARRRRRAGRGRASPCRPSSTAAASTTWRCGRP